MFTVTKKSIPYGRHTLTLETGEIARQAGGELIFVVASIGIVARQGSDWQGSDWQGDLRRSAVKSCAVILHKKTGRTLKPAGQIRKRYRTLRRQRTYY